MTVIKDTAMNAKNSAATDIYAKINSSRLSGRERLVAIDALRSADLLVDGFLWVRQKVEQAGTWFLQPSMKH
jgi:hypothetical protein